MHVLECLTFECLHDFLYTLKYYVYTNKQVNIIFRFLQIHKHGFKTAQNEIFQV